MTLIGGIFSDQLQEQGTEHANYTTTGEREQFILYGNCDDKSLQDGYGAGGGPGSNHGLPGCCTDQQQRSNDRARGELVHIRASGAGDGVCTGNHGRVPEDAEWVSEF